jgi:molecular chaperone GrpE
VSENNNQPPANSGPTEVPADGKIADLESQLEKQKNDYLYLRAEFDNFRKHTIKERSEYLKYGSERLIVELLNVLDNFERALSNKPNVDTFANYIKGVEMTAQELKNLLKNFGVTEVPCLGVPFDPAVHEAVGSESSAEVPSGHIIRALRKPYKLHDKVIRVGQVTVAK